MLSICLRGRNLRKAVNYAYRCVSSEVTKPKSAEIIARESNLPIERTSLTRGLALNRFEKDFVIYPEFTDTDDVVNIKQYVTKLQDDLSAAWADHKNSKAEGIPDNVLAVLLKNGVFQTFVPKEYGGVGLSNKELLCMNEALGVDLSTYMFVNQSYIATRLIQIFGSDEQKDRYLSKLASFQLKPAICMADLSTGETMTVINFSGIGNKMEGSKTDVINGDIADIFIIFAYDKSEKGKDNAYTCYLVDKSEIKDGKINVTEKKQTLGLRHINLTQVSFTDVPVSDANVLGGYGSGKAVSNELLAYGNFYLGAAVVGFMKKLLCELTYQANTTIQGNHRLAENLAIQRTLANTAMNTFILESVIYYLGGLLDEGLVLSTDIENAIIQLWINKVLREGLATTTQVAGTAATDESSVYDKMTRDINTLLSITLSDVSLVKTISLSMLVSWIEETSFKSSFLKANTFKNIVEKASKQTAWKNPKLKHFIAEHVHPSLEPGCRQLEYTMTRLDTVLSCMVDDSGDHIKQDIVSLTSLSTVLQNNFAMLATIARASRSYSIGLKNCDIELAWALQFCHTAARQSEAELEFILEHFGFVRTNPTIANVGAAVVEFGGYPIERPIERNW
jgi:acyl-CoA dehydrogenase family protein 9